ncbi:MAG: tRNA (N6-threonylcarbamoyladenosine(37)-N6)-methyltransferase TrmO [Clostridia bacterium]|nr:tRNA (N6-threonylcarbamoyladenosine(37)-N6)-methyltransferase TrmO [Clostridia bacterium]
MEIKPIAHIKSDFTSKFGIPRQSGLKDNISYIIMEPEFRRKEAFRGLEEFSHIWLIWDFSENHREDWSPTVRPPRLGGNTRLGVFATRSPFRPNNLGLSSVRLINIDCECDNAPVLVIAGADLMDGTPIYDIKPYIQGDVHDDFEEGFSRDVRDYALMVKFECDIPSELTEEQINTLKSALSEDPRPSYHRDENRIYGMPFAQYDVKFKVCEGTLSVTEFESI